MLVTLVPFRGCPTRLLRVTMSVFGFVYRLFSFNFRRVRRRLMNIAICRQLTANARAVRAGDKRFALARDGRAAVASNGYRDKIANIVFHVFGRRRKIGVRTIIIFGRAYQYFSIFRFQTNYRTLTGFELCTRSLIIIQFSGVGPCYVCGKL